jgi:hypothetical protein
MKSCTKCKQVLPLEAFHNHPRMKLGRQPACKLCKEATNSAFREEQREAYLLIRAKSRAKRKGLDCTITVEDIIIPPVCPYFQRPFDKARFAASLDRIDSNKGYVPGNVQVISRLANAIKWNASSEELDLFCQNWLSSKQSPE